MMVLILITLLIVGSLQAEQQQSTAANDLQARQVTALVEVFGQQLEHVALLGPSDLLESQLREHYGPYVADPLLEAWLAEPGNAPGRTTSSPWPYSIEVLDVNAVGEEEFLVRGEIVFVTSVGVATGNDSAAARLPVRLRVEREAGPWQITQFLLTEAQDTSPERPTSPPSGERVSISGEVVCLPKEGEGPFTLECALGLKTEGGDHYALASLPQEALRQGLLRTGIEVTVDGLLTSPPADTTYAIEGVIRVERLHQSARQDDRSPSSREETPGDQPESTDHTGEKSAGARPTAAGPRFDSGLPTDFVLASRTGDLPPAAIPPCPLDFVSCAYYAGDEFEGTTFISAGVAIRRRELPERECESTAGNYAVVQNVRRETLGDSEFVAFDTSGAAMNKVARDVVYRNWNDGTCFELVSRIATTNIGVYEPGTIEEFSARQEASLRTTLRDLVSNLASY